MTEILYCQSPALFLLAVVLLICFLLRRQAHRVRAALDLVLCILLLIGGVVLYYLGIYSDCFTIHDFWQIRTSGWVGLGVVTAGSVWHLCKVCKRGVERRRTERAARQTEEAHRQALESARREAYEAGKADAAKERQPSPSTPETSALPLTPADFPASPTDTTSPERTTAEEQVKPCKNPDTKPMTLWLQCLPNTVQPR